MLPVGALGEAGRGGEDGVEGGALGPSSQVGPAIVIGLEPGPAKLGRGGQPAGSFDGPPQSLRLFLEPVQAGAVLYGNHLAHPVRPLADLQHIQADGHVPLENRLGQDDSPGLVTLDVDQGVRGTRGRRGRPGFLDVQQMVAIGRAGSLDECQVAAHSQTAHTDDPEDQVVNLESVGLAQVLAVGFECLGDLVKPLARDVDGRVSPSDQRPSVCLSPGLGLQELGLGGDGRRAQNFLDRAMAAVGNDLVDGTGFRLP